MTKKVSIAEAKAKLAEVIRGVEGGGGPVVVERRGKPVAMIEAYDAAHLKEEPRHWLDALRGAAAGIDDFQLVVADILRSRRSTRPRRVKLEP